MTSLVLGVVGAAVGGLVGGPVGAQIGFLVGSLIGNLIDPPKSQGPRLGDLKLQSSTYGKFIPFFWGTGRLAGIMIDQTDLTEHKQKSGGKGGPQVTTYTYSASFAIMLGGARRYGEDVIIGVLRIWADGRLIWDSSTSTDPIPCTVYVGSETQLPDPTFEAIHGVGEVPAYRGYAYVVFTDYYLTDFGNRIPAFEFEVFTGGGDIPWRVSTFPAFSSINISDWGAVYEDGVITVCQSDSIGPNTYMAQYDIYGNVITPQVTVPIGMGPGPFAGWGWQENSLWRIRWYNTGGGTDYFWYRIALTGSPLGTRVDGSQTALTGPGVYGNPAVCNVALTYMYSVDTGGGFSRIRRWALGADREPGEADPVSIFALDATYSTSVIMLGSSFDDPTCIYVMIAESGPTAKLWKLSEDLTLIKYWAPAETTGTRLPNVYGVAGGPFYVFQGRIAIHSWLGGINYGVDLVTIADDYTLSDYAPGTRMAQGAQQPLMIPLTRGLLIDTTGVFSLEPSNQPVLLSKIVGDLSDMTPISGAYDTSELTDEVRWFIIGSQMTVRNAIQTLRQAFFFDAAESDDTVKFVKRDLSIGSPAKPITTIPDEDLCGRKYGDRPGDPLKTIRKKEQDLPRTVTLTYIDVDNDYQTGAQNSPRQTTLSQQDVTLEVPIGFTASEALQKCWTLQTSEWIERESFEWSTTRKWAKLIPTDPVYVGGRVIRIVTKNESPDGVLRWTGVLAAPGLYNPHSSSVYYQPAIGAPSDGFVPPVPPGPKVNTTLLLLDLPLIGETDFPNGYYAAVAPSAAGTWTGCELYESSDGGTTYASVGSSTTADGIGDVSGTLGDYTGGNSFDETNTITVVMISSDVTLASASESAVLNGANRCAVGTAATGWEVLQYKTATLIAADTYQLSGFLRGRYGTEWRMATHASGEKFVVLPTSINVNGPGAELGASRKFKAVSFGNTLAAATAQDFTNTGVALKPYAPVQLASGSTGDGNITITWVRRTRIGGTWQEGTEVPLSEETEEYVVRIYSDSSYTTLLNQYIWVPTTFTYYASYQATDFGSPTPSTIYYGIAQKGSYGYGYETRGHT